MRSTSQFYYRLLVISAWILALQAQDRLDFIVPAKVYLQLAYYNPTSHPSEGWCDIKPHNRECEVYFKLCVWNPKELIDNNESTGCNIAERKIFIYASNTKRELKGHEYLEIPIANTVPEIIMLAIEVLDNRKDEQIVLFASNGIQLRESSAFKKIELSKPNKTERNKDARLGLWFRMDCSTDYYGPLCNQYCKTDFTTFNCDPSGSRICYPGYTGKYCEQRDNCFIEPCAKNARCLNTGYERICYCNGDSGPECYEDSRVCDSSPCINGGICKKVGPRLQQFVCQCPQNYFGATCSQRFSWCEGDPKARSAENYNINETLEVYCSNGGTCIDQPNGAYYFCQCPIGWTGATCSVPDDTPAIVASAMILLLVFLLSLSTVLYWKIYRKKKPQSAGKVIPADSPRKSNKEKLVSAGEKEILNNSADSQEQKTRANAPLPQMRIQSVLGNEDEYDQYAPLSTPVMEDSQVTCFSNQ